MTKPPLNPEEVDALMSAIQDGTVSTERSSPEGNGPAVMPYDLTSQDRIIRGQMPTLDAINEQIASMVAIGLAGRTRLTITATSTPATLLRFADLAPLLAPPAVVCVLNLGARRGHALAVLEASVADTLLAAALGDRKARPSPAEGMHRELTTVEHQVLKRLLAILAEAMATAWAPVIALQPAVLRIEPDPRMAAIAAPNDVAIVSSFDFGGAVSGRMQVIIPFAAVESVKQKLSSPPRMAIGGDERSAPILAGELEHVLVEVTGILGRARLSFQRLLELKVGDVIVLDSSERGPLPVLVQGKPKLTASPCVSGGAMALVIDQGLQKPPVLRPGVSP